MWAGSPWADRPWGAGPAAASGGSTQTLTPSLLTNAQTFYAPTVTPGAVTVSPGLLSNTQTFYAPTVYDPAASGSSIRIDIATGRLVRILNSTLCISL